MATSFCQRHEHKLSLCKIAASWPGGKASTALRSLIDISKESSPAVLLILYAVSFIVVREFKSHMFPKLSPPQSFGAITEWAHY